MEINLLDPQAYANGHPYDQFRWLRENSPVHWHAEPEGRSGFWAVTRYNDAKAVLGAPEVFSSFPSTLLSDTGSVGDADHNEVIFSDPPKHTAHRAFLAPPLSPGAVKRFTQSVEDIVTEIIDNIIERGECDLVPDLAGKLASYSIADVLGLPRPDVENLYDASDRMINAQDRSTGPGLEAAGEIMGYVGSVWNKRGALDSDSFISRLASGEIAGVPMDQMQFSIDLLVLIAAGGDTTRNAFSGGLAELLRNPDQLRAAQADPARVRPVVEEMLRWVTPIAFQRRTATQDTEIAGVKIAKGQKVVVWAGSANRDPSIFANPETFDSTRSPNLHVTFGYGVHHCLGSHLARLELNVAVREVLRRMPDLELVGEPQWLHGDDHASPTVVGPVSMPVRFTPGERLRKVA